MMNDSLISVIIPIYKVERYLRRCIDSVISQTYKNLEIILVDDGSPDGCGKICDEVAKKDRRIIVIHKKNGGLSDARNAGLRKAKGDYFIFIDADDYIDTKMIQILFENLKKSNADISVCNYDIFDENENYIFKDFELEEEKGEFSGYEAAEKTLFKQEPQMVVAWNKLTKRKLWENRIFPIGKQHEDDFTSYQLYYEADKVVITKMPLYHYFQRSDSIVGVGFNIKSLDKIEAYIRAKEYFEKKDRKLYNRACNMVLIMNMRCMKELLYSRCSNKECILHKLRAEGRDFYIKNFWKIKRGLKYHFKLIAIYFFNQEVK